MLPQAAVGFDRSQLRLGVGAEGAPGCLGTALQDGAGRGPHAADVHGRPDTADQRVHPGVQAGAHQPRVALGLVNTGCADGDVQDGVQALEALLHVGVLWRPAVKLDGFLWKGRINPKISALKKNKPLLSI